MDRRGTAVHPDPIWREKTDYIFMAQIEDSADTGVDREQLWGRRVGDSKLEVCCIPFFIYGLALGDVVEVDGTGSFSRVLERSGRAVYRAWFGSVTQAVQDEVISEVERLGGNVERSSGHLVAVDAATGAEARAVAAALTDFHIREMVVYEVGAPGNVSA